MIENYESKFYSKYYHSDGLCEVCGKPLVFGRPQLAHRIPDTKMYQKMYGTDILSHELNLVLVCSLKCNSSVLIDKKTALRDQLVDNIKKRIA
jgi:hypothetical protein